MRKDIRVRDRESFGCNVMDGMFPGDERQINLVKPFIKSALFMFIINGQDIHELICHIIRWMQNPQVFVGSRQIANFRWRDR